MYSHQVLFVVFPKFLFKDILWENIKQSLVNNG
jgi:hypothetical protein